MVPAEKQRNMKMNDGMMIMERYTATLKNEIHSIAYSPQKTIEHRRPVQADSFFWVSGRQRRLLDGKASCICESTLRAGSGRRDNFGGRSSNDGEIHGKL